MANKGFQVQVLGLKELQKALRKLPPEYLKELKEIHKESAEPVKKAALSLAPRKSGALASTIRTSGTKRSGGIMAGSRKVPYAGVIHYGWPNRRVVFGNPTSKPSPIKAQPFLIDALRASENRVLSIFFRKTDSLMNRVFNKYAI